LNANSGVSVSEREPRLTDPPSRCIHPDGRSHCPNLQPLLSKTRRSCATSRPSGNRTILRIVEAINLKKPMIEPYRGPSAPQLAVLLLPNQRACRPWDGRIGTREPKSESPAALVGAFRRVASAEVRSLEPPVQIRNTRTANWFRPVCLQ
jgi:hypothetical protein